MALGVGDDEPTKRQGLFALRNRRFGEPEYATRIAGCAQNVHGVRWCKVTALGRLPSSDHPEALPLPAEPKPLYPIAPCGDHEVLQVFLAHLTLTAAAPPTQDPCEP